MPALKTSLLFSKRRGTTQSFKMGEPLERPDVRKRNHEVIKAFFMKYDIDNSGTINSNLELRQLVVTCPSFTSYLL